MRRHGGLAATLVGGFLAVGVLQIPASAQRSRVPDRDGGPARPAVERSAPERPAGERAAVAREVAVPAAAKPAGLVAIEPPRPSGGRPEVPPRPSGGDKPRDQGRGDGNRHDGGGPADNHYNDRRDGYRNDNRQDDARHDNRGNGTTGIVINPILVEGVYVGSVRLSAPTVIGRPIVIGGGVPSPVFSGGVARLASPYVSHAAVYWSEETIYLDDVRQVQHVEVSDEPVESNDRDLGEPRELEASGGTRGPDASPRRTAPSLASLGSQYSFRPWYAVSDFVMAGYPVPYPDSMAATYDKQALAKNADLPPAALEALQAGMPLVPYAPGTFGGVTFQIGPGEAAVYVDGVFAGLAEDFTPMTAPLPLMVGTHRIELRARGFRLEAFDVLVTLGQVTPLSGLLAPQ